TATVMVSPSNPATQQFQAFGALAGGAEQDITNTVSWSTDRPALATTTGGLATTSSFAGGQVVIRAQSGAVSGTARLLIKFTTTNLADGPGANPPLPTAIATPFAGTVDPARAPELVYPNNGVLLPPNLNGVEVHFRAGSPANTLFEIGFQNDATDVRVYTRCVPLADGCLYQPTPTVWQQIAETNRGGGAVKVSVRGTDDAGTGVGGSGVTNIQFSKDDVRGALYYWTTSKPSAILRWDFGSTTQTKAEEVITPAAGDGKTCVGCHAISRDGKKMVATLGGQNDGRVLLWDLGGKRRMAFDPVPQQRSQFESWNPDGSEFVGMYTDDRKAGPSNLIIFDGTTALKKSEIDLGGLRADHPDWSPDGARIVFTSADPGGAFTDQKPERAGLAFVERNGVGWSAPTTLLPAVAGKNRFYPAIAPNNAFIVFNESTCAGTNVESCDGDADPSAQMFAMPLVPGASPTPLANANRPGLADKGETNLMTSYPKWSPFVFQLNEEHQIMWATVSSTRKYGLRQDTAGMSLWMFAIDPSGVGAADPSFPAFCLPFQDLKTSNHIAQWTTSVPVVQ
ncbi:MAG TPA: hypothetical protein VFH73_18330, partial [Polyangia bacterium]|nr:hypothetical protein [Polyangia bacterium]